jgi:hypothetical protein
LLVPGVLATLWLVGFVAQLFSMPEVAAPHALGAGLLVAVMALLSLPSGLIGWRVAKRRSFPAGSLRMTFQAAVLTLYPEMFPGPLGVSLAGARAGRGQVVARWVQICDFANDKHRTVDDTPAGGGAGMVLRSMCWRGRLIMRGR